MRRLGLSTFRIAMILTTLRLSNVATVPNVLICDNTDFQTALTITKTIIHHAAITPQQRLLQSLPQEFDRKKYLEVAKTLNIPDKTAEKQIERYLNSNLIERIGHGIYKRR